MSAACQSTGPAPASRSLPWADDPRAGDKTRLWRYLAVTPEGAPLASIVRGVFGDGTALDGADATLAWRFYRENPDLFRTDRRDGLRWVEPQETAFTRPPNKHRVKPSDGGATGGDRLRPNTRAMLDRWRTVEEEGERGYLLGQLAAYRETTEDRYHAFEDTFTGEHLLVPYATRFNSGRRVAEAREAFDGALARAAERHDRAVLLTLTTDPARFESLADATDSLLADVNRLKSWLATDARMGERPESVVVVEFTESGLPHAHVLLFGVSWVVPHSVLSAYWSGSRDRGEVVWFDRLTSDGERWSWEYQRRAHRERKARGLKPVGTRSPQAYLGKSLGALAGLAEANPEGVREAAHALRSAEGSPDGTDGPRDPAEVEGERERAETGPGAAGRESSGADGSDGPDGEALARGREWWRLALYWATETRLYTLSPSLKSSTENGDRRARAPDGTVLPADAPPRWRYIGTARYEEFPASIRRGATVLPRRGRGRPPPGPVPLGGGTS